MRMSCLITTLNPMTDVANPARPTQSLTLIFNGSSAVIIEKGRAMFTLFLPLCDLFLSLRDTALCAGRDLRARGVPLSAIHNLLISQADGTAACIGRPGSIRTTLRPGSAKTSTADKYSKPSNYPLGGVTESSSPGFPGWAVGLRPVALFCWLGVVPRIRFGDWLAGRAGRSEHP
jgi:hypothetical protein